MLLLVSACSLALVCFSGPKTGSKQGPKSPPAILQIMQIAHVTRSRHSCGRVIRRFASPRGCVVHASASLMLFQSARSCEPCGRVTTISALSCGRVIHAAASLLAGHLLNFLCSFHFCKPPFQSPSHSCPIKPETLNTQITASNGIKEN